MFCRNTLSICRKSNRGQAVGLRGGLWSAFSPKHNILRTIKVSYIGYQSVVNGLSKCRKWTINLSQVAGRHIIRNKIIKK